MQNYTNLAGKFYCFLGVVCISINCSGGIPYGKDFRLYEEGINYFNPLEKFISSHEGVEDTLLSKVVVNRNDRSWSSSEGPYHSSLIESYLGRALTHLARKETEHALEQFSNALHIVRVVDGLETNNQKPILRNIQAIHYLNGDFDSLGETYEFLFNLDGGERLPYNAIRLEFILEYLEWRREAIRLKLVSDEDLLSLYELTKRILKEVESDLSLKPHWLSKLALSQLSNLYLISNIFGKIIHNTDSVFNEKMRVIDKDHGASRSSRLLDLASTVESNGRRILDKLIQDSSVNDTMRINLLMELGDWFQWHSKSRKAKIYYKEAYSLSKAITNLDNPSIFNHPVELPSNGAFAKWTREQDLNQKIIIPVTFDVSSIGRISNIKIDHLEKIQKKDISKFRRKFNNTRFRPKLDDGVGVEVVNVKRQYELINN